MAGTWEPAPVVRQARAEWVASVVTVLALIVLAGLISLFASLLLEGLAPP